MTDIDDEELESLLRFGTTPTMSSYHSLGNKNRFVQRSQHEDHLQQESPWDVTSPMTRHMILSSRRSMKRVRSRSFDDYLDARNEQAAKSKLLSLPTLSDSRQAYNDNENCTAVTVANLTPLNSSSVFTSEPASSSPIAVTDDFLHQKQSKEKKEFLSLPEGVDSNKWGSSSRKSNPLWVCAMYGMINATIVLPVLMSFGAIIYRDDAYHPYMPILIKLTLVSGVVHQVCFSSLSSLPFAVGSVQDAGLIFLSQMTANIAKYVKEGGYDDEHLLATALVGLALATALLGLGLIVIGRLRLAGYVQMLPSCVVGGYLAFIGWFCGQSGVLIMATNNATAGQLTLSTLLENSTYILPGIMGGILIYCSVRILKHAAVLPVGIGIILLSFYIGLGVFHRTFEDATHNGWIRESANDTPLVWYHIWDYFQFDKVVWSALPQLVVTECSMIFVVALSSSLDVAAIELEMDQPLDYNRELTMVGISNVVSGLTGGYTGSYIFSQSIFSLRAGIASRKAGFVLALCELFVIVAPFPILSYVPNFFYGSLLTMICVDLMYEWLWEVRENVTVAEYIICLATFALIQLFGVEYGILAGVVLYVLCQKCHVDVGGGTDIVPASTPDTTTLAMIKEQQEQQQTEQDQLLIDDNRSAGPANYGTKGLGF